MTATVTSSGGGIRVHEQPPAASGAWQRLVHELPGAHLAHAHEWAAVIRHAYGHEPLYLAAEDGEGAGLLPAFIVRRPFVGTAITSMPFLDGGGPCSSSARVTNGLVESLIDGGRRVGASFVELRCSRRLEIPWEPAEHKVNLTLPLPADADKLWGQLDRGVRNQLRKAQRSGLSVDFGAAEKLDQFYEIFAIRMRELGSPVHGRAFFRAIVHEFGGQARIGIVRHGTTPVGGLLALGFKDTLTVPWASCLSESKPLCANMLLYWETIRTACQEGFRSFDFGRSSRGSGTYQFKRQWGGVESPLFWYTIPIDARTPPDLTGDGPVATCLSKAWRHLPLTVTRGVGPCIRRYLIQ